MKTKRGIYHNIEETEYRFTIGHMTFCFSSPFYLKKFMTEYQEEVDRFNVSINNIYKNQFDIDMKGLALVRLYANIEKRGFYIIYRGVEIKWLDDLTFVLQTQINSLSGELTKTSKRKNDD